jgi:hypothetical protein
MTSNNNLDISEKQSNEELDMVPKLIDKWKNMTLDEDSDDDFDLGRDRDKPEYDNKELWSRR